MHVEAVACHLLKQRHTLFDLFGDLDRIGTGDLLHLKHHTRCIVVSGITLGVTECIDDSSDIFEANPLFDLDIFEILDAHRIGFGLEGKLSVFGDQLAAANLDILC